MAILPIKNLKQIIAEPIENWKETIINDFEENVFNQHQTIKSIKEKLYEKGAVYASMSGSGSSVYGISEKELELKNDFKEFTFWSGKFL